MLGYPLIGFPAQSFQTGHKTYCMIFVLLLKRLALCFN